MEQQKAAMVLAPKRRKMRRQAFIIILLLALGVLGAGWALMSWIKGLVLAHMVQIEQVQRGRLEATCQVEALVIRNETVVTAPAVGSFEPEGAEGRRVAVGAGVGRFIPVGGGQGSGLQTLPSPRAGLVYYSLDGLEGVLGSGHLDDLDLEKLGTLEESNSLDKNRKVDRGTPLARIVDNLAPVYLYVTFGLDAFPEPLTQGGKIKLYLGEGQETATGKWARLQGTGQRVQALVALEKPPAFLWESRRLSVGMVTKAYNGIILPQTALVEKEGNQGVYRLDKLQIEWVGVTVMGQVDGQVVVEGLEAGSEIITNPKVVFEGQKLP